MEPPEENNANTSQPRSSHHQVIISNPQDNDVLMESLNMENHLPSYNVREKIIIALDTATEENSTNFIGTKNEVLPPLKALISATEMFIRLKQQMNKDHEFALAPIQETEASFFHEFTTNFRTFVGMIKGNVRQCKAGKKCDLTSLFTNVVSCARSWEFLENPSVPPPYVVRLVLLYNRSHTVPEIDMMQRHIKNLVDSPYFFLDVLVTHEPVSEENNCEKIFRSLQNIDTKGYSYFFNVGRNLDALVRSVVKLTAHPLQRPLQTVSNYSF